MLVRRFPLPFPVLSQQLMENVKEMENCGAALASRQDAEALH